MGFSQDLSMCKDDDFSILMAVFAKVMEFTMRFDSPKQIDCPGLDISLYIFVYARLHKK